MRFALEFANMSYDLPANSNASHITIRLADECLEDPRCNFTQSKALKMQRRAFEHPSARRMVPPTAIYTTVQEKKLLLKLAQPPNFKGEGVNVERDAEVWLEAMDDYFEAVGTHPQNQTMLAMFRLTGDAKIWWKTHCRDSEIIGTSQTWEQIKDAITARYLLLAHKATKMNEVFSLRQLSSTLEEYYSKFVTLRRYAPKMTLEQQVARFCQGLIEPLNNRLEALRPTTLQDALLRAKPLAKEIKETTQGRHDYPSTRTRLDNWNNGPTNQAYQSRPVVAATIAIEFPNGAARDDCRSS
ncbi:hypothetical protein L7F22_034537 [Adiantum nelumboides]|nr:hypothetical protein [Adiantum nelumboides]